MNKASVGRIFLGLIVLAQVVSLCRATPAWGAKVHLVVAYDDTPQSGLGADIVADRDAITGVFRSHVPAQQLSVVTIEGKDLSPGSVVQRINALQVERHKDSVVFYFTGHGAFDKQQGGHYFSLPGRQRLLRTQVLQAMIQKEPRTAVTITDCCAAFARFRAPMPVPEKAFRRPASRISLLFQRLFLDYYGTISITSSEPGQLSITRGDGRGSLFTYPFVGYLDRHANKNDLTWERVFGDVQSQVHEHFQTITKGKGIDTDGDGRNDQATQTAHAFLITPRLGMRVLAGNGELKVTEVVPLSPAFHAGLEVGDVLLAIDTRRVRTEGDYGRAVDSARRDTMKIKVRDHKTGKPFEIEASLNPR